MTDRQPSVAADPLTRVPDWFKELALDLEAGRLNPDQAQARLREHGVNVLGSVRTFGPAGDAPAAPPSAQLTGETFDPFAAWLSLSPELQQTIGAAAIAAAVCDLGIGIAIDQADLLAYGPLQTAGSEALGLIHELVAEHIVGGDGTEIPPRPDLGFFGIRQCRACGCTDAFGCDNGCSWVEADLCSACVPGARR